MDKKPFRDHVENTIIVFSNVNKKWKSRVKLIYLWSWFAEGTIQGPNPVIFLSADNCQQKSYDKYILKKWN